MNEQIVGSPRPLCYVPPTLFAVPVHAEDIVRFKGPPTAPVGMLRIESGPTVINL